MGEPAERLPACFLSISVIKVVEAKGTGNLRCDAMAWKRVNNTCQITTIERLQLRYLSETRPNHLARISNKRFYIANTERHQVRNGRITCLQGAAGSVRAGRAGNSREPRRHLF